MRDKSKEFLLENWIFAFLAALVALLALSAVLLSLGSKALASQVTALTLSALVVGITVRTAYYLNKGKVGSAVRSERSWHVKPYLSRNWGVPFVIVFVILLAFSGISLGEGNSLLASRVAIFAFSVLVAGMLLEIASRAGRGKEQSAMHVRSKFWISSRSYLKENWGAPFVLAFIALLIASAVLLSGGNSDSANGIAVYAFYALVIGVVLQIASYVKYGGKEETL